MVESFAEERWSRAGAKEPEHRCDACPRPVSLFGRASDHRVMGKDRDGPITRAELERALRFVNLTVTDLREDLLRLAAQVVALTEVVTARVGGESVEDAVGATTPARVEEILAADERSVARLVIADAVDKYEVEDAAMPCAELMPICHAACCTLDFALSSQDLDEGVVRWDYGRPYIIAQRDDGYCVHNAAGSHACEIHAQRPATCRRYACKDDKRIWDDFDRRIPAAAIAAMRLPS